MFRDMSAFAAHGTEPTSFPCALLDAVFRRSAEAVLVIDPSGCVVYASPGAEALLAIEMGDEASGCPLTSLVHPDDLPADSSDGGWSALIQSGVSPAVRLRAHGGDWVTATLLAEAMSDGGFDGHALTVRRELAVASDEQTMLAHIYREGSHALSVRTGSGTLVDCNDKYLEIFGVSRAEARSKRLADIVAPEDRVEIEALFASLHAGAVDRIARDVRVRTDAGESLWVRVNGARFEDTHAPEPLILSALEDVSEFYRQRDEIEVHRNRLQRLVDNVPALILRVDRDSKVLLCGPGIEALGDVRAEDMLGVRMLDFITEPEVNSIWRSGLQRVFEHGELVTQELQVPTVTRELLLEARAVPEFDRNGEVETALVVAMDVTHSREIAEKLLFAATHDSLTGLANRETMQSRLKAIQDHPRHTASLIIIDLDRFKLVNDSMGHAAGDEVLRIVSQRIRGQVRQSDLVARLGGDEFAVVVADMDTGGLVRLAERIRSSVELPCNVEGRSVPQTISIGIAGADPTSSDAELMVRADRALYASKANGRNRSMVFDETLRDEVTARLTLERELRHAIDHDELKVLFQPEFDMRSKALLGAEALLRWSHPTRGDLAADSFIDVAEASGLIVEIGRIALRAACREFGDICQTLGRDDLTLRVNISAREFARSELTGLVASALSRSTLRADQLCLEMTETTLMDSPDIALESFGRLHELGVQFAIDDFGTGYSSLTYLKRFPVDAVKIDRSFVIDIMENSESRAIVESIIGLADALSLEVVAEGVETEEQLELLGSMGCRRAQGWLFSRAVDVEGFVALCQATDNEPSPTR